MIQSEQCCRIFKTKLRKKVVIAYGSQTLSSRERNYCVTWIEMLAMVHFVKHFKQYLLGLSFLIRTDHGTLVLLHKSKRKRSDSVL